MKNNQSPARGTQFLGFAKLLMKEMLVQRDWIDFNVMDKEEIEAFNQAIARRAYDFAAHVVSHVGPVAAEMRDAGFFTPQDLVESDIPDLTEWPEESKEK